MNNIAKDLELTNTNYVILKKKDKSTWTVK